MKKSERILIRTAILITIFIGILLIYLIHLDTKEVPNLKGVGWAISIPDNELDADITHEIYRISGKLPDLENTKLVWYARGNYWRFVKK